ncbi:MAG: hypothetical protein F6K50_06670 [Moorea sp. SIO3I7]|uniref:hypothetical protein n=1 Tax=Moorena sp. SIO3I8 TaxID=2607833 RepID=UPI0013C066C0|nr:hypothetical protein [Moorena sp. SIO3I8]NEN95223.1 hypothetical protein [Moorena sp. SIO3I7]NEO05883.1 hypothetical protein [Moorena sp. SIO3I8]
MNDTLFQINNISVILYAFHLCQDLTQEVGQLRQDAEGLWQNCAKLSKPLAIEELKCLPQKIQSYSNQTLTTSRYSKLLEQPLRIKGSNPKVKVEPHKIDDTYALDLTLKYNNVSKLSELNLNPQGCLLASTIQASLGQTLVLYGEPVGTPEEDSKLANACVDAFFQGTDEKPQFSASGQLFGSPIFAYDNGKEKPTEQCHLLVWLNRHPETLNLAQKTYFSLLNLLCCRSKILFAYDQARWCYRQTRGLYGQLEQEVQGFKELPRERKTRLEQLKQKLTEMPSKTFDYAGYLRDMEDHKTAIATNAANYNYWLKKISESSLKDDNIEFLEDFLNQRTELFQNQIQVNLNYLKPGQQLFDQMLGSIRGIVETEQAQQEKRLERWIASVGIGLAVSGISSQTDAKPLEAILIKLNPNVSIEKCPKAELQSCLSYTFWFVLFHVLLGVGVGAITALILGRK